MIKPAEELINDDVMYIRGIPLSRREVAAMEHRVGGMLFDEIQFAHDTAKRLACANVIDALDKKLWNMRKARKKIPDYIDIGDKLWLYIPILLFEPGSIIKSSKVAWFRVKRFHKV